MSTSSTPMQPYGDNFIPVIPVDELIHTDARPFCADPGCFCHDNPEQIARVDQFYQDGLLTTQEATQIVKGTTPL